MSTFIRNKKGVVLFMTLMYLMLITLLVGVAMTFSYNIIFVTGNVGADRMKAYYYARSGLVDAHWRMFNDNVAGILGAPPTGGFSGNPGWDPAPYNIDVDGNGVTDVTVNISAVSVAGPTLGLRTIDCTGTN